MGTWGEKSKDKKRNIPHRLYDYIQIIMQYVLVRRLLHSLSIHIFNIVKEDH